VAKQIQLSLQCHSADYAFVCKTTAILLSQFVADETSLTTASKIRVVMELI